MDYKNIFYLLNKNLFLNIFKSKEKKFKKFIVSLEIVFYILKYYFLKFSGKIIWNLFRRSTWQETKSFLLIFFISFFFYYFVVIELSILLFGYSLLCYRFLFILIVITVILSWQLEIHFLKRKLHENFHAPLIVWTHYYNNNPLSLHDFLTNYKHWPLFWFFIINKYKTILWDGWLMLVTFFSFLIFFFIYSCGYWFDPWVVNFVIQAFYPIVNFFETWWNPWLEDFTSTIIWFWHWFFALFEYKYGKDSDTVKFLKQFPKPSTRLEDWANLHWSYKISLKKTLRFSDIFFLRSLWSQPALHWLVFSLEQPNISMTWFDQNWKILFFWYIKSQYENPVKNFWKRNFLEDQIFWTYLIDTKNQINEESEWIDTMLIKNYSEMGNFKNSTFEALLSKNYFDSKSIDLPPLFQTFGSNWDFYNNIVLNNWIKKNLNPDDALQEIFTKSVQHTHPFTITGLWTYYKHNQNNSKSKNNIDDTLSWLKTGAEIFFKTLRDRDFRQFKNVLEIDLNIQLYNFYNFENFSKLPTVELEKFFKGPVTDEFIFNLFNYYNFWLAVVENEFGLHENVFWYKTFDDLTLGLLTDGIAKRLAWVDVVLNNQTKLLFLQNQLPSYEDIKYYARRFFKLSNFTTTVEWKSLKDAFKPKEIPKETKKIPSKLIISRDEILKFFEIEQKLWTYERLIGFRKQTVNNRINEKKSSLKTFNFNYPWFIKSLGYFSTRNYRFILPGFVRYYYPTPFPTTFTSFGKTWFKYQIFWKNTASTIVGHSDSIAELWNSTPVAIYSGVEAILYIKPIFEFFEFFVNSFIKLLTYPIEFLLNHKTIPLLAVPISSIFSLAFFAHFLWFIHFYIYIFIAIYISYYAALYYHRKVGFLWFYEWMFQDTMLSQYNNRTFWYSITDIWVNYKQPDQLLLFAIHTNLLLYYTFFQYSNFFFKNEIKIQSIITVILNFTKSNSPLNEFDFFSKIFLANSKKLNITKIFTAFWSFYNVWFYKYRLPIFTGGVDCNLDQLIWSYYEYLNQSSLFLSWGLWKNFYNIDNSTSLISIIKQFTILLSSMSLAPNYLSLPMPLLDTVLSRKLLLQLINKLEILKLVDLKKFSNKYFYTLLNEKKLLEYIYFMQFKIETLNQLTNTGFDIYSLLNAKSLVFLTKLNSYTFWEDLRYWILIFFWSFWFVLKNWYPSVNLHLSYEDSWLHLARIAYANSWLGQSMYVWPFFNVIQHIWWTSGFYIWSFELVGNKITKLADGPFDNVWNFYEKWYSSLNFKKIETIFGLSWVLDLTANWYQKDFGFIPYENKNFDLSFTDDSFEISTTNWGYQKTNPPLNVPELNLTPNFFFSLFKNLPVGYLKIYFTFFSQLEFIDEKFKILNWDLSLQFDWLDIYSDFFKPLDYELALKYDFYFKNFDFHFKYVNENSYKNYVFTFDVSFFLNHFTSWDFFSDSKLTTKSTRAFSKFEIPSTPSPSTLNAFLANFDLLAILKTQTNWFKKPFGVLDKYELHTLKSYKTIKTFDEDSFSWSWDDIFLSLDTEHTCQQVGLTSYPQNELKTLREAYSEDYSGAWDKRFPYNYSIVRNAIGPIYVGWVGELVSNTIEITNFMYSLLYASSSPEVNLIKNPKNTLAFWELLLGGQFWYLETFFYKNFYQKQYLSWAFSWVNLTLVTNNYRYSFGPKAQSWQDHWSWKCGICLDYKNGLYSYRPYFGYRHSFFARLIPYDPLYGFYKTYRQLNDNPLAIDLSTDAIDFFIPKTEEAIAEDLKNLENPVQKEQVIEPGLLKELNVPYWEVYYSLHHPYFIGYLFFWVLVLAKNKFYLGLSNFSFKRLVFKEFLFANALDDLSFAFISNVWSKNENRFRKQMFRYRMYYSNPTQLLTNFDCLIDDELLEWADSLEKFHRFWLNNNISFSFLKENFGFSCTDIWFLLDFKKIYSFANWINWLTLDSPFVINSYLTINNYWSFFNDSTIFDFYIWTTNVFSHTDSLNENYNYNLFFDWASGSYLDNFNLISYVSTTKVSSMVNNIFFENPTYIASSFLWFNNDKSADIAKTFYWGDSTFINHDILISNDLSLHNLAILEFFQESIQFFASFEAIFFANKKNFFFINFYIRTPLFKNFNKFWTGNVVEIDSKIATHAISPLSNIWQLIFIFWCSKNLSYDLFTNWIVTGLFFSKRVFLNTFYRSLRFWLNTWYLYIIKFYKWLGFFIKFLIKK